MPKARFLTLGLLATLIAAPAFAADPTATETTLSTDVNQQQQIEDGLKSGELSTGEAARLEKGEQHIDNAQAHALKGGVNPAEAARLQHMQTNQENRIQKLESNGVKGNPSSASSKRMQGDVQRNVNQEQRIENGVANGSLTNHEAAKMEHGQAKIDRAEAHAGKNGNVGAAEQRHIQAKENHQNKKIHHAKHNKRHRPGDAAPADTGATTAQ